MMIDFHSHMLPCMDDGSKSIEESMEMMRLSKKQGVSTIVFTPHFYPTREAPEEFLQRRQRSEEMLREGEENDIPEHLAGAEVAFFHGLSGIDQLEALCIGESRFILIEMPFCDWNERVIKELDGILSRGFQPIIAHIERYPCFHSQRSVEMLVEKGYLIQSNGEAFLQGFHSLRAFHYLKKDWIHVLGSDSHHSDIRKPNLQEAVSNIEKYCGEKTAQRLFEREKDIINTIGGSL